MKLSGRQLDLLHKAIYSAYNEESLKRIVRFNFDERLHNIATGRDFKALAFSLLDWAEREGVLPDLIQIVLQDKSKNNSVKLFAQEFENTGNANGNVELKASDLDRETVKSILSACYRRAIFTRMHAQLSHEAMFASISDAIGMVQPLIPRIESEELQEIAANIVAELDFIVRCGMENDYYDHTQQINTAKIQILHSLILLADKTSAKFTIPSHRLTEDAFFTKEEADNPPELS